MKARFWLILTLMLFINNLTYSQSSDWPLSPSDVFAPGIEIREIEVEPSSDQPLKSWDDELRLMVIDGNIIPYPEIVSHIIGFSDWGDPVILVTAMKITGRFDSGLWSYNRNTGDLAVFEDPCKVIGDYEYPDHPWVISTDPTTGDSRFCKITTGELIGILPPNRIWELFSGRGDSQKITVSPDGRWLGLIGNNLTDPENSYGTAEFYSYEFATNDLVLLGTEEIYDSTQSYYFERWVGQHLLIDTGTMGNAETTTQSIIVTTAGQKNSLHSAISGHYAPTFIDNPPRYITGFGSSASEPCGRTIYDIETNTLTRLNLDGLCSPEYGSIEAVGYYRDVPAGPSYECCLLSTVDDVAEVPVIRYDIRTGERQELYRGEVEKIVWISPDERLAILLIDNNRKIDWFPYRPAYDNEYRELNLPMYHLIDLNTDKSIAITSDSATLIRQYSSIIDWSDTSAIYPLGDGRFIVIYCDNEACGGRNYLKADFIQIVDGTVLELAVINDPIFPTPDRKQLLVWSQTPLDMETRQTPDRQGVNIYNLETGQITPFIQELPVELYDFELMSFAGNAESAPSLQVTLRPKFDISDDIISSLIFQVSFEPDQTPYVRIARLPETIIEQHVCVLTTQTGVNLRVGAGGDLERFGTADAGKRLVGIAQEVSSNDGLIWYELNTGGWVREDFVSKTSACTTLTDTSINEADENTTIEPTSTISMGLTCQLTTLLDVNFRSEPSTESNKTGSALTDTILEADGQIPGADSFTWWRLVDVQGWVRQDLVAEAPECASLPVVTSEPLPTREPGLLTCNIITLQGINFRAQPSTDSEKTGSAAIDTVLEADGQIPGADSFTWWRLVNAQGWVRQDLVAESEGCTALPVVALNP